MIWLEEILADQEKIKFGREFNLADHANIKFWQIERNIFPAVSWQSLKYNKGANVLLKLTNFSNEIKREEFLPLILCLFMFLRILLEIARCSK